MRLNEKMKKVLSALLCLCMLVQNAPVVAFAAGEDNLCAHGNAEESCTACVAEIQALMDALPDVEDISDENEEAYPVTLNVGENGSVSASINGETVESGDSVPAYAYVDLIIEPATGYALDILSAVDANETTVIIYVDSVKSSFEMPSSAVTVTVTFKKCEYHNFKNGTCIRCGTVCQHPSYENGKCAECKMYCPGHQLNENGFCTVCDMREIYIIAGSWKGCEATYDNASATAESRGNGVFRAMIPKNSTTVNFSHSEEGESNYTEDLSLPSPDLNAFYLGKQIGYDGEDRYTYTGKWAKYPCAHNWVDSVCTECGTKCSHSWAEGKCTACGKVCSHPYYSSGNCGDCGIACQHPSYENGKCAECRMDCPGHQLNEKEFCTVCDMRRIYMVAKDWDNCTVRYGEDDDTMESDGDVHSIMLSKTITEFYFWCPPDGDMGKSTIDLSIPDNGANCYYVKDVVEIDSVETIFFDGQWGFYPCEHNWENSECTICGEVCSHSTEKEENKANCTRAAVCDTCGAVYGEVDKSNHDSSVAYKNGFCPNGCYEPAKLEGGIYEISNAGQLYWFAQRVNSGDTAINGKLMDNIVVNQDVLQADGSLNDDGSTFRAWTPIGKSNSVMYTGTFDGGDHTVSGLYFSDGNSRHVGLFGAVNQGGKVQDLGVVNSYLWGEGDVGGVVGVNSGTVTDCYNTGIVRGEGYVGGMVGYNGGDVTDCYNTGTVRGGESYAGGVAGVNSGTVTDCYNTGDVSSLTYAGGVAGVNSGTVTNCYNTGDVSGFTYVGGVAGVNSRTVTNCYYNTTVYEGQAIGDDTGTATNVEGKTSEQFASGEVAYLLGDAFGQTIGSQNYPTLGGDQVYYGYTSCGDDAEMVYTNSDNASQTKPDHTKAPTYTDEGNGTHSVVYPCCGTTAPSESHSTGKEENKANCARAAVCDTCGAVYGEVDKTNHDETVNYENGFCPYCDAYEPAVLKDEVYEISNAGQLYWFAQQVNSGNVEIDGKLMNNIVVNEGTMTAESTNVRAWTPIGNYNNQYDGTFDGGGHTVSGLYFNDGNTFYVGLFGYTDVDGRVQNVGVTNSYFHGRSDVGGVVGYNHGAVTNCYNTGTVSGANYVGGVVGYNHRVVTDCYNTGTVSGANYVGGVVGYNRGIVTNCYNTCTVSGADDVGGVVGYNLTNTITNCYNTGAVSGTNEVGGVVGYNATGTVTACYNTGAVSGADRVGGVAGYNNETVTACYNTGTVSGSSNVGGVVGRNNDTITNCYYNKTVYTGKAIGTNTGTATNVEDKTTDQFASGEVAYLLNGDQSEIVFKQTLGTDPAPKFTGKQVYYGYLSCGDTEMVYTNSDTASQTKPSHSLAPTCTDNGDGRTHRAVYPCCGTTVASENHSFDLETGKCICNYQFGIYVERDRISDGTYHETSWFDDLPAALYYAHGGPHDTEDVTIRLYRDLTIGQGETHAFESQVQLDTNGFTVTNGGTLALEGYTYSTIPAAITGGTVTIGQRTYNWDAANSKWICADEDSHITEKEENQPTCTQRATCDNCGESYGEVDKTNHDETVNYENGFCPNGCYEPAKLVGGVYEIYNAGNLYWFAQQVNSGNVEIDGKLMNNIVVNEGTITAESTNVRAWTPIGNSDNQYDGTFDGGGHTVSGLYFNDGNTYGVGLFGYTDVDSRVQNVGVTDSYFHGKYFVGGVVGANSGTVTDCYNTGTVSGADNVGGVAGRNNATVTNCYNTGAVSGTENVGGVVGNNNFGTVTDCYNTGTVSEASYVGGVAGANSGTVTDCYNTGTVSGARYVGGVTGLNTKIVTACYNTGTVSGTEYVGGVAGGNNTRTITNCYNTGAVSGARYVGGVTGLNTATVTDCYNTGTVSGTEYVGGVAGYNTETVTDCYNTGAVNGSNYVGGVVGRSSDTVTNCYYDKTVYEGEAIGSNLGTATNVEGKTTAQFASGEVAYLLNGDQTEIVFKQTIGTDSAPKFTGKQVYYGYTSCRDAEMVYTNSDTASQTKPDHTQDPTYTDEGNGTHSVVYPCCGNSAPSESHSTEKEENKPTCTERATCDDCGAVYGSTVDHSMGYVADQEAKSISYRCATCDTQTLTFTLVIPTGAVYGDSALAVPHYVSSDPAYTGMLPQITVGGVDYKVFTPNAGDYEVIMTWGAKTVRGTYTIAKAKPAYTAPTGLTATYGQKLADVTLPTGFAWTDRSLSVGNAGTNSFAVTFTPEDQKNYQVVENIPVKVTVSKAASSCTAPTAKAGLTYKGEAQTLINPGTATGGTLHYRLSQTGNYAEALPTGLNAGTYTVYYKVVGDSNHNDTEEKSLTVTIAKGTATVESIPARKHFNYVANSSTLDLSACLPQDRGETAYTVAALNGSFFEDGVTVTDGKLSYTTKVMTVAAYGSIQVKVVMENYRDVTLTVPVELVAVTAQTLQQIQQTDLTEVPAGLRDTEFNTLEKIKEEQQRILVTAMGSDSQAGIAHYDVKLLFSPDGGKTWVEATEANFPANGLLVTLPYPTGTGKDSHNFFVSHMFTVGEKAGTTETPAVTKTAEGIQFTVTGLSPVSVAWTAVDFDVKIAHAANGTVRTNVSKAASGTKVTITVTPDYGYKLSTLTVMDAAGKSYFLSTDNNGKYYFTMPDADVTVKATFTKISIYTPDPTNPKTGDGFEMIFWSGMMMSTLVSMAVLVWNKKKFLVK